jgi:hypothetical protein
MDENVPKVATRFGSFIERKCSIAKACHQASRGVSEAEEDRAWAGGSNVSEASATMFDVGATGRDGQ